MSLQEFEEEIQPYFIPQRFHKKEFLLSKDQVCHFTAFITKGLTRTYTVDEDGSKQILAFGLKDYWITDRESFSTNQPSRKYIQTLEETECLLIDKNDFERLFNDNEHFRSMITQLKEKNAIVTFDKVMSMKIDTAEVRYSKFMDRFPSLVQRIPQHMIASYLGIKPETLSRLRKNPNKK